MDIEDKLLLGPEELRIIKNKYPDCIINRINNSDSLIQQYRFRIHNADEESYFNFLLDNCIGMSSEKFYSKVKSDKAFTDRMKARIADETRQERKS